MEIVTAGMKLENLKVERDAQLAARRAQVKQAEALTGITDEAKAERVQTAKALLASDETYYAKVLAKQAEAIKADQEISNQLAADRASTQAASQAQAKERGRRAFLEAGGVDTEFEAAWPGILQSQAVAKLASQHAPALRDVTG
jgi:chromosome segregation ATPase